MLKRFFFRIISAIVVSALIVDPTMAAAVADRLRASSPLPITIPPRWGRITETWTPRNDGQVPLVVLIQDLHGHPGVQRNIAEILKHLSSNVQRATFDVGRRTLDVGPQHLTVFVEGASGPFDVGVLRNAHDSRVRNKAVQQLLKESYLTGSEIAAIESKTPMHLWGVDDKDLYLRNLEAFYKASTPSKESLLPLPRDPVFLEARPSSLRALEGWREKARPGTTSYRPGQAPYEVDGVRMRGIQKGRPPHPCPLPPRGEGKLWSPVPHPKHPAWKAYFEIAAQRDIPLALNALRHADLLNQTAAPPSLVALVAGGYHTEGLTRILKANHVPYAVVAPRVDGLGHERAYAARLSHQAELARANSLVMALALAVVSLVPADQRIMLARVGAVLAVVSAGVAAFYWIGKTIRRAFSVAWRLELVPLGVFLDRLIRPLVPRAEGGYGEADPTGLGAGLLDSLLNLPVLPWLVPRASFFAWQDTPISEGGGSIDTPFDHYLEQEGFSQYGALRGCFTNEIREVLLDDPALRAVFALQLPKDQLGPLRIVDPKTLDPIGGEKLLDDHSVFLAGRAEVANQLAEQGHTILVGVTDRPSDDTLIRYCSVASGRQCYFPLPDGTWLGVKGSGQFVDASKPPYYLSEGDFLSRTVHMGVVSASTVEKAIHATARLRSSGGRFVQILGYRDILAIPDGEGGMQDTAGFRDSNGVDLKPRLVFNRVLHPHRLVKFPQLLKTDPALTRLRQRLSQTLINIGALQAGTQLSAADLMLMMAREFGRQEALKQNALLFKTPPSEQDYTWAAEEMDNESFDTYQEAEKRAREYINSIRFSLPGFQKLPHLDAAEQLILNYKLDVRGLRRKVMAFREMYHHAKMVQQDTLFFPSLQGVYEELFRSYFESLDDPYLRLWATPGIISRVEFDLGAAAKWAQEELSHRERPKPLKIAMVSTEFEGFATSGGLGHAVAGLARALASDGHQVEMYMPLFKGIDRHRLTDTGITVSEEMGTSGLKSGRLWKLKEGLLTIHFVENDEYFSKDHLYGFANDDERFAFFDKAALAAMEALRFQPDVIHCHDWPTGLIPAHVRKGVRWGDFFNDTGTVYTFHNLRFKGAFNLDRYEKTGLPWDLLKIDGVEFNGQWSFAKAGMYFADVTNTVSPHHAEEIRTPEFGEGFEGLLRGLHEEGRLLGISNGVSEEWNPATHPGLQGDYAPFDQNGLGPRSRNKAAFQKELGLQIDPSAPLIGILGRVDYQQKGLELLLERVSASVVADLSREGILLEKDIQEVRNATGLDERTAADLVHTPLFALVKAGAQIVIHGAPAPGDVEGQSLATRLVWAGKTIEKLFPGRVHMEMKYDKRPERIFAAVDVLLNPSRYEPFGYVPREAAVFGTVPVVRRTGGLVDAVTLFNSVTREGNGFVFDDYTADALLTCTLSAIQLYAKDKDLWRTLQQNAMAADYSWRSPVQHYLETYHGAMERVRRIQETTELTMPREERYLMEQLSSRGVDVQTDQGYIQQRIEGDILVFGRTDIRTSWGANVVTGERLIAALGVLRRIREHLGDVGIIKGAISGSTAVDADSPEGDLEFSLQFLGSEEQAQQAKRIIAAALESVNIKFDIHPAGYFRGRATRPLTDGLSFLKSWYDHEPDDIVRRSILHYLENVWTRLPSDETSGGALEPESELNGPVPYGYFVTLKGMAYFPAAGTIAQLWSNRRGEWGPDDASPVRGEAGRFEITVPVERNFEFTFRFSSDGGRTWRWANLPNGNGRVVVGNVAGAVRRFWEWAGVQDLVRIGRYEGSLLGIAGGLLALLFMRAMPHGPPLVSLDGSPLVFSISIVLIPTFVALFIAMFAAHYFLGVLVPGYELPTDRDAGLSWSATWTAMWSFASVPLVASGWVMPSAVLAKLLLVGLGLALSGGLHGWRNSLADPASRKGATHTEPSVRYGSNEMSRRTVVEMLAGAGAWVCCWNWSTGKSEGSEEDLYKVDPVKTVRLVEDKARRGWRWLADDKVIPMRQGVAYMPTVSPRGINDYVKNHKLDELYAQLLPDHEARKIHPSFRGVADGRSLTEEYKFTFIRLHVVPLDDRRGQPHQEVDNFRKVMRRAYTLYGLRVYLGDFLGLFDPEETKDVGWRRKREGLKQRVSKLVELYGDEPWLAGISLGNENEFYLPKGRMGRLNPKYVKIALTPAEYYAMMDEVAGHLKDVMRSRGLQRPVFLSHGDFRENTPPNYPPDQDVLEQFAKLKNFDGIGLNLYTSPEGLRQVFGHLRRVNEKRRSQGAQPLAVMAAEFGQAVKDLVHLSLAQRAADFEAQIRVMDAEPLAAGRVAFSARDEKWKVAEEGPGADKHGILGKRELRDVFRRHQEIQEKRSSSRATGAVGLWRQFQRTQNWSLGTIGLVEGLILGAAAALLLWGLLPQGPPHHLSGLLQHTFHLSSLTTSVVIYVLSFAALAVAFYGVYRLVLWAHRRFGVIMPGLAEPVFDPGIAKSATRTALHSFWGVPLIAWGLLGHGWGWIVIGIAVGGLVHGWLNHRIEVAHRRVINTLKQNRVEAGLHTVTGSGTYQDVPPDMLVQFSEELLRRGIMPAVDNLEVLRKLRRTPLGRKAVIAFLIGDNSTEENFTLARRAISRGADVLMGSNLSREFILRIEAACPRVVIFTGVSHNSSDLARDLDAALESGAEGIMFKRFPECAAALEQIHRPLQEIRREHPDLIMVAAGGVFEGVVADVLSRPEHLIAAVGFNALNLDAFKEQAARYAENISIAFTAGWNLENLVFDFVSAQNPLRVDEIEQLPSPGVPAMEIIQALQKETSIAISVREKNTGRLVHYSVALPERETSRRRSRQNALYWQAAATLPRYQRQGIATRSLAMLMERARREGFTEISAFVEPGHGRKCAVETFLMKMGAQVTEFIPSEDDKDVLGTYQDINRQIELLYGLPASPDRQERIQHLLNQHPRAKLELRLRIAGEADASLWDENYPGALGLWRHLPWTRNWSLRTLGLVEGLILGAAAALLLWGLLPQGPPAHLVYEFLRHTWHLPSLTAAIVVHVLSYLALVVAFYGLYRFMLWAHHRFGVIQPGLAEPVFDLAIAKRATQTAMWGVVAAVPSLVVGLVWPGFWIVKLAWVIAGLMVGAGTHAALNQGAEQQAQLIGEGGVFPGSDRTPESLTRLLRISKQQWLQSFQSPSVVVEVANQNPRPNPVIKLKTMRDLFLPRGLFDGQTPPIDRGISVPVRDRPNTPIDTPASRTAVPASVFQPSGKGFWKVSSWVYSVISFVRSLTETAQGVKPADVDPSQTSGNGADAVGHAVKPEDHDLINASIRRAAEDGRYVDVYEVDGTIRVELGHGVEEEEVDVEAVRAAFGLAAQPLADGYRTPNEAAAIFQDGRLRLILDGRFLMDETPSRFALGHGGRGLQGDAKWGYLTYDVLIGELMRQHEQWRQRSNPDSKARLERIERAVCLLIRHEVEHGHRKLHGDVGWENPIEVAEILSLLAGLGVIEKPPTGFLNIESRSELDEAYGKVWEAAGLRVQKGEAPAPLVDLEPCYSIGLAAGGADFPEEFRDDLDRLAQNALSLDEEFRKNPQDPERTGKLRPSPKESLHITLFGLLLDWLGGPIGLEALTPAQREKVQQVLNAYGPLRVHFTGLNVGPDGAVFAEGHVDDEAIFEIRRRLGHLFPDIYRRTPLVHISLIRPVKQLTPQQFRALCEWVARHRKLDLGTIVMTRPFLRLTKSRFGFEDLAPERVEFPMGGNASPYLYRNTHDPFLALDDFDREHYYWDKQASCWRSRHFPKLVLGSFEDIRPAVGKSEDQTEMQNHVAIRLQWQGRRFTVYVFDNHKYSPMYLKEAQKRGEVPLEGNDHIFVDLHSDYLPLFPAEGKQRLQSMTLSEWRQYTEDTVTFESFVNAMVDDDSIARHFWAYDDTTMEDTSWQAAMLLGSSSRYPGRGVVRRDEQIRKKVPIIETGFEGYFANVDERPREQAIVNIDTDGADRAEKIVSFLRRLMIEEGVFPCTMHITTSPPNFGSVRAAREVGDGVFQNVSGQEADFHLGKGFSAPRSTPQWAAGVTLALLAAGAIVGAVLAGPHHPWWLPGMVWAFTLVVAGVGADYTVDGYRGLGNGMPAAQDPPKPRSLADRFKRSLADIRLFSLDFWEALRYGDEPIAVAYPASRGPLIRTDQLKPLNHLLARFHEWMHWIAAGFGYGFTRYPGSKFFHWLTFNHLTEFFINALTFLAGAVMKIPTHFRGSLPKAWQIRLTQALLMPILSLLTVGAAMPGVGVGGSSGKPTFAQKNYPDRMPGKRILEVSAEIALPPLLLEELRARYDPQTMELISMMNSMGGIGPLLKDRIPALAEAGLDVLGVTPLYEYVYVRRPLDGGQRYEMERIPLGRHLRDSGVLEDTGIELPVYMHTGEEIKVKVWKSKEGHYGKGTVYFLDAPDIFDVLYARTEDSEERIRQSWLLGRGALALVRHLQKEGIRQAQPDFIVQSEWMAMFAHPRVYEDPYNGFQDDPFFETAKVIFNDHTPLEYAHRKWGQAMFQAVHINRRYGNRGYPAWIEYPDLRTPDRWKFDVTSFLVQVADYVYGVSEKHGDVMRDMPTLRRFADKIDSITNGASQEDWQHPLFWSLLEDSPREEKGLSLNDCRRLRREALEALEDFTGRPHGALQSYLWEPLPADIKREAKDLLRHRALQLVAERTGRSADWVEQVRSKPLILWTRRLVDYKMIDILAEILSHDASRERFVRMLQETGATLLWGGRVHQEDQGGVALLNRTLDLVRQHGLDNQIVFFPNYSIGVAPVLFHGADASVMISEDGREASATGFMKVQLNGGFVIASNDGGIPESVAFYTGPRSLEEPSTFVDKQGQLRQGFKANGFEVAYENVVRHGQAVRAPTPRTFMNAMEQFLGVWHDPAHRSRMLENAVEATRQVRIARVAQETVRKLDETLRKLGARTQELDDRRKLREEERADVRRALSRFGMTSEAIQVLERSDPYVWTYPNQTDEDLVRSEPGLREFVAAFLQLEEFGDVGDRAIVHAAARSRAAHRVSPVDYLENLLRDRRVTVPESVYTKLNSIRSALQGAFQRNDSRRVVHLHYRLMGLMEGLLPGIGIGWGGGVIPTVNVAPDTPRRWDVTFDIWPTEGTREQLEEALRLVLVVKTPEGRVQEFHILRNHLDWFEEKVGPWDQKNNYRIGVRLPEVFWEWYRQHPQTELHYWFRYRLAGEPRWRDSSLQPIEHNGRGKIIFHPDWLPQTVPYTINLKAWGGFGAVLRRLADLKELGVNALILQYLHPGPTAFSIDDFEVVNPDLEREASFEDFVREAKNQGFRIILPFVPNHSGVRCSLLQERPHWYKIAGTGQVSEVRLPTGEPVQRGNVYPDWAPQGETWQTGDEGTQWGFQGTAQFNIWDGAIRRELVDYWEKVLIGWIERVEGLAQAVDGFYGDTGHSLLEVDKRMGFEPGLIEEVRARVRRRYPNVAFGFEAHWDKHDEIISGGASFSQNQRLYHDLMDHQHGLVYGHKTSQDIMHSLRQMPKHLLRWMLNFIENHDEERLAAYMDWAIPAPFRRRALKALFALIALAIPGIPFLHSGQEIGMTDRWKVTGRPRRYEEAMQRGESPDEAAIPLLDPFADDGGLRRLGVEPAAARELRYYHQRVLQIRSRNDSYLGDAEFLNTSDPHTFVSYRSDGSRRALVAIHFNRNASEKDATWVKVDLMRFLQEGDPIPIRKVLADPDIDVPDVIGRSRQLTLQLRPFQVLVLEFDSADITGSTRFAEGARTIHGDATPSSGSVGADVVPMAVSLLAAVLVPFKPLRQLGASLGRRFLNAATSPDRRLVRAA